LVSIALLGAVAMLPAKLHAQVGQDVILLHGIRQESGDDAWNATAVKTAIQLTFAPRTLVQPTTAWRDPIAIQAARARDALTSGAPRDNVTAIGYSLGGLVAREYAKDFNSSTYPRISTIITLDSPLSGAPILKHLVSGGLGVAADLFVLSAALLTEGFVLVDVDTGTPYFYVAPGWEWEALVAAAVGYNIGHAVWDVGQAASSADYRPGATPLAAMNNNACSEANVNRASIIGIEHDPEVYRLAASAFGDGTCAGDQGFLDAIDFIKDVCTSHEVDALLNYADTGDEYWLYEAAYWETQRDIITHFPKFWRDKVLEAASSDGIVPASSEAYPNQPDTQFKVQVDCINHLDTQNSSVVASRVIQMMQVMAANPLPLTPVPPASLFLSGNTICSSGSVTLGWCANNNATAYDVELFANPTGTGPPFGTVTGVTTPLASFSGLTPGTVYSWHVRGTNRDGPGAWSSLATFSATAPPQISATFVNSSSVYWGETQQVNLTVTNSSCPTTFQWRLTNGRPENYSTNGSGTSAYCINDYVMTSFPLTYEVIATNVAGSTTSYITFNLYARSRPTPPPPGCPYVAPWNGIAFQDDNNILPQSEDGGGNVGARVTDRYLLSKPLVEQAGQYRLQLREFEHERTEFDHVQLLAVDYPENTELGTLSDGTLVSFQDLGPARGSVLGHGRQAALSSAWRLQSGDVLELSPDPSCLQAESGGPTPVIGLVGKGAAPSKPPIGGARNEKPGGGESSPLVRLRQRESEVVIGWCSPATGGIEFAAAGDATFTSARWVKRLDHAYCISEAPLTAAVGPGGTDHLAELTSSDGRIAELRPGEAIECDFTASPVPAGMKRRFVLVTDGRYERLGPAQGTTEQAAITPALELQVLASGGDQENLIRYSLDRAGLARITIFDIQGREVSTPFDGFQSAGAHELRLDGRTIGSGVYFARLTASGEGVRSLQQKFVIVH